MKDNITEALAEALRDLLDPTKTQAWETAREAIARYDAERAELLPPPHWPEER